jgi:hypothetical protein
LAYENAEIAGAKQILTVSDTSITRIRSCLSKVSDEPWGKVKFVVLDDSRLTMNSKTQNALSFPNWLKMRGASFQALVTVTAVPPTDETCFGDTALIDAAPPKNMTLCKACRALILELARVPCSCEVNMRHKYPVPTLIKLDSENKTAVATEDPFTIDSDDVIKLKSEFKSV